MIRALDFYMPMGKSESLEFGGKKYLIRPWDEDIEPILSYLNDESSALTRCVNYCVRSEASRRLLLRSHAGSTYPECVHVKEDEKPQLEDAFQRLNPRPGSVIVPFLGNLADTDSAETRITRAFEGIEPLASNIIDPMRLMIGVIGSVMEGAVESVGFGIADKIVSDPSFRKQIRMTTPRPQVNELAQELWNKGLKQSFKEEISRKADQVQKGMERVASTPMHTLRAYRILRFLKDHQGDLARIHKDLSRGVGDDNEIRRQLVTDLAHEGILTDCDVQGLCLEAAKGCPHSVEKSSVSSLPTKCEFCDKESMVWMVFATPQKTLSLCWRHDALPELVIGGLFRQEDWVRNVFVHKQILESSAGNWSKGAEIDVIVRTAADKLYFIEVTTQRDLENVHKTLDQKIKALDSRKIDFDALFYFAGADLPQYHPVQSDKVWMLGVKHMEDPVSNVKEIVERKLKQQLAPAF